MKQASLLLTLVLLFALNGRAADEYANGYLINQSSDTLKCRILIPKDFGRFNEQALFSKVTILDSAGNRHKYTPDDINGYAFVYHTRVYVYVSRVVSEDGKKLFLWPAESGPKINEYYYYTYNTDNLNKGSMGATNEVYVLEDAVTKETAAITRGGAISSNYKDQLRKFFESDKTIMTILVRDVKDFHDIDKFVKDANNN
jgi:hypothetical protein